MSTFRDRDEEEDVAGDEFPPLAPEDGEGMRPITDYFKKTKISTDTKVRELERTIRREKRDSKKDKTCFKYDGILYCVPIACMKNLQLRGLIGSGESGQVRRVTIRGESQTKYVVKIIKLTVLTEEQQRLGIVDDWTTESDFRDEVRLQEKAAKIGAAPRVLRAFTCSAAGQDFGFIIMERFTTTLGAYVQKRTLTDEESERLRRMVLEQLENLHEEGIVHGDLSPGNIVLMINSSGIIRKLAFIDFGREKEASYGEEDMYMIQDEDMWKSEFLR
jgi:serine/threonine protein kinase